MTKTAIVLASPVHTLARKVADNIDIDLGKVRRRFQGTATKAINKSVSDIRDVMNSALAKATRDGLTSSDASAYIIARLRKHGVQPRSTAYIDTLVRTHAAISYGAGHRQSFLGDPDTPWGYEYVTVGDDRVRPEHEELDGIRRRHDDAFWEKFWPPNGWNCRCQAVAIYDEDTTQTRIPKGVEPDEGFDTDFTELL
jgi:SPP1 gp7 family putative phage head morphogenesis protein